MIISDDSLNKKTIDIGTDYLISLFVRSLVRSFIHAFIHLNCKAERRIRRQQKTTFSTIVRSRGSSYFTRAVRYVTLLQILQTIPFHQLDVKVLSVEYVHGRSGKASYVQYMTEQGYKVHKDIDFHDERMTLYVNDFIFVKKSLTNR